MNTVKKAGILTAAAGGLMAASMGAAHASADADAAAVGSPGVLSGNVIQVPVHVPINLCGNSINIVGLINPAFGNHCANIG